MDMADELRIPGVAEEDAGVAPIVAKVADVIGSLAATDGLVSPGRFQTAISAGLFNALFFVGLRFSESELQHFPTNRPGIAVLGIPPTRIAMTPCQATFTVAGWLPCRRSLRLSLCWPRSTIQDVPKARCIGYLTSCCLLS